MADDTRSNRSLRSIERSGSIRSGDVYHKDPKRKRQRDDFFRSHRKHRAPEMKYRRNEKNYWPRKCHYYFFVIMIGNGPDVLPYMICFSLEISGGMFLVIYLTSAFFLAMPLIYMEVFLGRYTTFTNSQMYRMAPVFFGFGVMVLVMNMFFIPMTTVNTSHFFINFLKLMIEPNLFKQCPYSSTNSSCYDGSGKVNRRAGIICDHGDYNCPMETRLKFVSEYLYWDTFRSVNQESYPHWQLAVSLIVTWIVIGVLLILGLRLIGTLLRAMITICLVIFAIIYIMALTLKGAQRGLTFMASVSIEQLTFYKVIVVAFYTIGKLGILIPTGFMTSSAYAKFPKRLGTGGETLLLVTCNVIVSLFFYSGMYAIGGALALEYGYMIPEIMSPLVGLYLALVLQFLTHMDSPNSFILCYLFFFWFVQVVITAVMVHLIILNLYDYLPQLSYFPNYVVICMVGAFCSISLIACLHLFVFVTDILAVNYIILCINTHVLIESLSVSCCYGVKRLCDDIHFFTGRKPMRFWVLMWYSLPAVSFVCFMILVIQLTELRHMESVLMHKLLTMTEVYAGGSLLIVTVFLSFAASFLFAVLSFRSSNTDLLKPQFYWGPPRRDIRNSRKSFAPRTSIRSEPPRKKKQRFRVHSIKQMHEQDIADKVKRGRIYVDGAYFRQVHLGKGKSRPLSVDKPTVIYK